VFSLRPTETVPPLAGRVTLGMTASLESSGTSAASVGGGGPGVPLPQLARNTVASPPALAAYIAGIAPKYTAVSPNAAPHFCFFRPTRFWRFH
jgi:hypothetical protein